MARPARRLLALLLCFMLLLCVAPGMAESSLGAYRVQLLPDGATRYDFDEVSVTVPASWTGKLTVLEYGSWAAFCHRQSNRLWRERGDETGGLLFALCLDETADFREEPSFRELGRTDRGYYYLSYPTDLQAYADDEAVTREYMALWGDMDIVSRSAEVTAFHAGAPMPREAGPDEAVRVVAFDEASAPYAGVWVPFEDGFRMYVPKAWRTYEITGAESAAGIFYRAGDGVAGAAVGYLSAGDLQTREDLAGDFERAGFEGIEPLELNGIEAVAFRRPSDDYRGVAFFHPSVQGYILLVYASPLGEAGSEAEAVGEALLDSVSPHSIF